MTTSLAEAETKVPLVAFIGESQVGKSSLVNALATARLVPTTGTGAPRSQAVCELFMPSSPTPDATWRVSADWLPTTDIARVVTGDDTTRAALLRKGLSSGREALLARALRRMNATHSLPDVATWAAGRDISWLPLDTAVPAPQARRQLEVLTAGWPAALASQVRVRSEMTSSVCLVDLPGLGHGDVGGEASAAWLEAHALRVAAIVCVVGKRTPDILADVLHKHWQLDELCQRLHIVATLADHLVEDPSNEQHRGQVARARRLRAAEDIRGFTRGHADGAEALSRTFCLDPRPNGRFWHKVEFDGEMERLQHMLASLRPVLPLPASAWVRLPVSEARAAPRGSTRPPPGPPMGLQRGEDIEQWITRVVMPSLRQGRWQTEPLRSGRRWLHLQAADNSGHKVTLATVSGTGRAYLVAPPGSVQLRPPTSEAMGKALHAKILEVARELGLSLP